MTNAVPFSEELWKQGWKPVTRDGRKYKVILVGNLGVIAIIEGEDFERWYYPNGRYFGLNFHYSNDLLLLPPDPEIVVEVGYDGLDLWLDIFGKEENYNIPPGKYKLIPIVNAKQNS